MSFGHENLDVYQLSITYVTWAYSKARYLSHLHKAIKDQWLRASQSIPLNIVEGNGKATVADRRRYFEIARGSTFECAAVQDILSAIQQLPQVENQAQKKNLIRITAMLTKLGGRGFQTNAAKST